MSRISAALATAFARDPVPIFILAEFEFDSGTVRYTTYISSIIWDSKTWSGVGGLMAFDFPEEAGEIRATGGTIELNGLDPVVLALADTENYQGRRCTLYVGAFDTDGTVVVDPDVAFRGVIDTLEPQDEGETARIVVALESRVANFDRPRERRYTPEDQALRHSGDKGFDFVAPLQDKEIVWGP